MSLLSILVHTFFFVMGERKTCLLYTTTMLAPRKLVDHVGFSFFFFVFSPWRSSLTFYDTETEATA